MDKLTEMAGIIGEMNAKVDLLVECSHKMEEAINGNGQPGLKVRVDRAENFISARKKLEWPILLAVLGLVVNTILGHVFPGTLPTMQKPASPVPAAVTAQDADLQVVDRFHAP